MEVVVTEITTGGAAEEAGLLAGNTSGFIGGEEIRLGGDLILRADNTTIKNATALNEIIRKKEVGDNLTLTIFRGDHIKDIPVNVSSRPGIYFENSSIYSEPENITFVSYESLDLELGIKHPSNWDIDDYSRPDSVYFRSLPEYSSDSARDYLRIDVEEGYGDSSDTFACCFWFFIAQN